MITDGDEDIAAFVRHTIAMMTIDGLLFSLVIIDMFLNGVINTEGLIGVFIAEAILFSTLFSFTAICLHYRAYNNYFVMGTLLTGTFVSSCATSVIVIFVIYLHQPNVNACTAVAAKLVGLIPASVEKLRTHKAAKLMVQQLKAKPKRSIDKMLSIGICVCFPLFLPLTLWVWLMPRRVKRYAVIILNVLIDIASILRILMPH